MRPKTAHMKLLSDLHSLLVGLFVISGGIFAVSSIAAMLYNVIGDGHWLYDQVATPALMVSAVAGLLLYASELVIGHVLVTGPPPVPERAGSRGGDGNKKDN